MFSFIFIFLELFSQYASLITILERKLLYVLFSLLGVYPMIKKYMSMLCIYLKVPLTILCIKTYLSQRGVLDQWLLWCVKMHPSKVNCLKAIPHLLKVISYMKSHCYYLYWLYILLCVLIYFSALGFNHNKAEFSISVGGEKIAKKFMNYKNK